MLQHSICTIAAPVVPTSVITSEIVISKRSRPKVRILTRVWAKTFFLDLADTPKKPWRAVSGHLLNGSAAQEAHKPHLSFVADTS